MSVLFFDRLTEQERDRTHQDMKNILEDNEMNQKLLKEFKENTISPSDLDLLFKRLWLSFL